jgi:hypothetical protein
LQLQDLKKSLTQMTQPDALEVHRLIRMNRLVVKVPKTKVRAKQIEERKVSSRVHKDKNKLQALLALLEED